MTTLSLLLAFVFISPSAHAKPEHFDLEMTTVEYRHFWSTHPQASAVTLDEPSIAEALAIGKRLSDWLAYENARRPANQQLRLTSQATRIGVPIEAPSIYNPEIIQTKLDAALAQLPVAMKSTLTSNAPFPASLPTDELNFTTLGRVVEKVYQSAARWKSLKAYRNEYAASKYQDLRGYYFLNKNGWDAARIAALATEAPSVQAEVKGWLKGECLNAEVPETTCVQNLADAELHGALAVFFSQYHPLSKKLWNQFFVIPSRAKRSDITWNSQSPFIMNVPFNTPSISRIQTYLSDNIEDEWKFGNWKLKLNFGSYPHGPEVRFQTGVVPHVNDLGGNIITMDQNESIEEYETQWTIRHEFGHVLGFPDCYLEFYDTELGAFVNYQLDTTDLMCSRAGNMKERLYQELQRVYYTP